MYAANLTARFPVDQLIALDGPPRVHEAPPMWRLLTSHMRRTPVAAR